MFAPFAGDSLGAVRGWVYDRAAASVDDGRANTQACGAGVGANGAGHAVSALVAVCARWAARDAGLGEARCCAAGVSDVGGSGAGGAGGALLTCDAGACPVCIHNTLAVAAFGVRVFRASGAEPRIWPVAGAIPGSTDCAHASTCHRVDAAIFLAGRGTTFGGGCSILEVRFAIHARGLGVTRAAVGRPAACSGSMLAFWADSVCVVGTRGEGSFVLCIKLRVRVTCAHRARACVVRTNRPCCRSSHCSPSWSRRMSPLGNLCLQGSSYTHAACLLGQTSTQR